MFCNSKAIDKKYGLNIAGEIKLRKEWRVISTKSRSACGTRRMERSQITPVIFLSLRFLRFSTSAKASVDPVELTVYKKSIQYNSTDNVTQIRNSCHKQGDLR